MDGSQSTSKTNALFNRVRAAAGRLRSGIQNYHTKGKTRNSRTATAKLDSVRFINRGNRSRVNIESALAYRIINPVSKVILKIIKAILPNRWFTSSEHYLARLDNRTFGVRYKEQGLPDSELKYFLNPQIVVVEGYGSNPFCHTLMCFSSPGEKERRFCHVNDLKNFPEFMNQKQFVEYLGQEGGNIRYVYKPAAVSKLAKSYEQGGGVPNLEGMHQHLQRQSRQPYFWKGPVNNCLTFCRNILEAGGVDTSDMTHLLELPVPTIPGLLNREPVPPRD